MPRTPDGRIDWLIVEGIAFGIVMVSWIVMIVIYAVLNG